MTSNLIDLRNIVADVMHTLCQEGNGSTPNIVATVRKKHPQNIRLCSTQLEDAGLKQLVDDVKRRRPKSSRIDGQPELPGLPEFISVPPRNGMVSENKLFGEATVGEVKAWLAAQTPPPRPVRELAVVALLDDNAKYITSDEMKIKEVIADRAREITKTESVV